MFMLFIPPRGFPAILCLKARINTELFTSTWSESGNISAVKKCYFKNTDSNTAFSQTYHLYSKNYLFKERTNLKKQFFKTFKILCAKPLLLITALLNKMILILISDSDPNLLSVFNNSFCITKLSLQSMHLQ